MRLFVALDIDEPIRERITHFRDAMRTVAPSVRWVGPETFHITLQFLGETQKLEEIQTALATVKGAPTAVSFRGAGFFPNPNRARVFWVGIESDEKLQDLVNAIGTALAPLGFQRDQGPYHPHLTLARAGSGRPHAQAGRQGRTRIATGARETRRDAATRVRYNDGAPVHSVSEHAKRDGFALYQAGELSVELKSQFGRSAAGWSMPSLAAEKSWQREEEQIPHL